MQYTSAGQTTNARCSSSDKRRHKQRKTLTSKLPPLHNFICVGLNFSVVHCNVGMGYMCPMTAVAESGRCGWEDNGVEGLRDKCSGNGKVNHSTMSMSMDVHGAWKWSGIKQWHRLPTDKFQRTCENGGRHAKCVWISHVGGACNAGAKH